MERQGAVQPRFRDLGQETQGVVDVDVMRRGQYTGRRECEIFGDGSGGRGDRGSVIGAVDGDGQGAGPDRAVIVDDAVGQGVGKRFPDPEGLYGGQAIVEGIGVGAVGVERQGAVCPGCEGLRHETDAVVDVDVARRRQGSGCGDLRVFDDRGDGRRGDGRVIGTVDGDGQGVGGRAAVAVADRIGKRVAERFPDPEGLHGGQAVVEGIGIGPVGTDRQGAVDSRCGIVGEEEHDVMGVGVRGAGQETCGGGLGVFGDGGGGAADGGNVVGAVDGYGQGVGACRAVIVPDGIGEHVEEPFPDAECLHGGQAVVEGIGIGAIGIEGQRPVCSSDVAHGLDSQDVVGVGIARDRHGTGSGEQRVLGYGSRRSADGRRIVGAVDGDGQGVGGRAAVAVADRVGKRIGGGFPHAEGLYGGQAVVQRIGVRSVGREGERAVKPGLGNLGGERQGVVNVRVLRGGQGSRCGDPRVFGDGGGGGGDCGNIVCAVDGHGQGAGGASALAVRHRVLENVGQGFAHAECLHGGQAVVECIGVGAVGVQGQGSETPCFAGLGREGQGVPDIRIEGRGDHAAGRKLDVLRNAGRGRGQHGQILGTIDGDGQGIGGRAAVSVVDGVGESVGDGFARTEALHQRRGVVERVGIRSVGMKGQGTVKACGIGLGEECHDVVDVRVLWRRQGSRCGDLRVFGNGSGGRGNGRDVVGAVDGHGEGTGQGHALAVGDAVGQRFGQRFALAEALYGGQAVIQRIGGRAVRRDGEYAVLPL